MRWDSKYGPCLCVQTAIAQKEMDLREDDGGDEIEIQNQLRRDKEEDVLNLILID